MVSRHFGHRILRTQDNLAHHLTGAEVSGQFGISAKVSHGHFGTGAELTQPSASIFLLQ